MLAASRVCKHGHQDTYIRPEEMLSRWKTDWRMSCHTRCVQQHIDDLCLSPCLVPPVAPPHFHTRMNHAQTRPSTRTKVELLYTATLEPAKGRKHAATALADHANKGFGICCRSATLDRTAAMIARRFFPTVAFLVRFYNQYGCRFVHICMIQRPDLSLSPSPPLSTREPQYSTVNLPFGHPPQKDADTETPNAASVLPRPRPTSPSRLLASLG